MKQQMQEKVSTFRMESQSSSKTNKQTDEKYKERRQGRSSGELKTVCGIVCMYVY